jgi:hypothetical protein
MLSQDTSRISLSYTCYSPLSNRISHVYIARAGTAARGSRYQIRLTVITWPREWLSPLNRRPVMIITTITERIILGYSVRFKSTEQHWLLIPSQEADIHSASLWLHFESVFRLFRHIIMSGQLNQKIGWACSTYEEGGIAQTVLIRTLKGRSRLRCEYNIKINVTEMVRLRKYLDLRGMKQLNSLEHYIARNLAIRTDHLLLLEQG